jgi:site-specific recombinase XerC
MQAYKTSQGNWQVNFSEQGRQKTLYLGRDFTSGSADRVARIVTDILSCRNRGDSLPLEIFRKIESLPARVQRSFERLGLIGGVMSWTLEKLLQAFYESKNHLKPKSQESYKTFGTRLLQFFGTEKKISSIEKLDCERFKIDLLAKYSVCTVSRGIRSCRSIFKFAVDTELLSKNPFAGVSGGIEVNLSRQVYVDRETIYRVMAHCRDDADRLLLALARFGGLRIPSEIRHLRFCDFTGSVIRIHPATKTGAREVPLFGEIREIINRMEAGLGENFSPAAIVFANLGKFRYRIVSAIAASGVERWEKLFVNLRSSCITDMAERGYTEKTLDAIFGNSAAVRSRHYVQFRKEKEYAKVLADNARMLEKLREGADENALSSLEIDDLLVLRDLLVNRFGTGKKAS